MSGIVAQSNEQTYEGYDNLTVGMCFQFWVPESSSKFNVVVDFAVDCEDGLLVFTN